MKKICFAFMAISLFVSAATAAPSITGENFSGQPKDAVHKTPNFKTLRALSRTPAEFSRVIGASGTKKIAVVLMEFPSAGANTSGSVTIANRSTIMTNLSNLTSYYSEVSYGALNLSFTVMPTTVTATNSMSYYGTGELGGAILTEAIQGAGVQKGTGAGQYDAILVVHAGEGNETTASELYNYPGNIWSAFYGWTTAINGFTEGIVAAEVERAGAYPLGVYCHETGHLLGLPDIYSTASSGGSSVVGKWCLMDMGCWAGNGSNPSLPNPWCRSLLGWTAPVNVAIEQRIILNPAETDSNTVKIPITSASSSAKEYFLSEYRSTSTAANYDRKLPGSGILVWHVDEEIIYQNVWHGGTYDTRLNHNIVNNKESTTFLGVDLEEAGSIDSSVGSNYGTPQDPWPGTKSVFSGAISNSNIGTQTWIKLSDFDIRPASAGFSLNGDFAVTGITPSSGFNHVANVNIAVTGENISYKSVLKLRDSSSHEITATTTSVTANSLGARVNLLGAATGFYDVALRNGYFEKTVAGVFEVKAATTAAVAEIPQAVDTSLKLDVKSGLVELQVPAGAFTAACSLAVTEYNPAEAVSQFGVEPCGTYIQIVNSLNLQPVKTIILKLGYGNLNINSARFKDLAICRYDDTLMKWVVLDSTVDEATSTVTANIDHLSVFGLFLVNTNQTVSGVYTYPNPYKPGSGTAFGDTSLGEGVVFKGLTENVEISIYNIAGELVRDMKITGGNGTYLWDAQNSSGQKVASGVYIYLVTEPGVSSVKKTGKQAIIR